MIVDVRRLAELQLGATAILALWSGTSIADLDWLNLNRPVLADRRLNVVLWCQSGAAGALAHRAPDFFDWISVRIDCPHAAAAHAVAEVKRAIRARAAGIAWDGPMLEDTLAAVRAGRTLRWVEVASYQSMIDALTSREPGWLFLEGVDTPFHLRRLRWAMAETGRRVIVFRRAIEQTAPGWWTVHAVHTPIVEAVHALAEAGGSGRLAALTGLDPEACAYARFALRQGIEAARLETLLATASDPRAALQDFAQQSGWITAEVIAQDDPQRLSAATRLEIEREAARHARDDDPVVSSLNGAPVDSVRLVKAGDVAYRAGDYEVALRWLSMLRGLLPASADRRLLAQLHFLLGLAHHKLGDLASARAELERGHSLALEVGDGVMVADAGTSLATVLLAQGEPRKAREHLESALHASEVAGDDPEAAARVLDMLATMSMFYGDLAGARQHLERSLSIKRGIHATEDHPGVADTLDQLGLVLDALEEPEGARSCLERSLDIKERLFGPAHPQLVRTLRDLASVIREMGDLRKARVLLDRALEIQRIASGTDEHPEIAEIFVAMARVVSASGDLDRARELLERAFAIQQKVFGEDGGITGSATLSNLALVLVAKGDLGGAREHLERSLAHLRKRFGEDENMAIVLALRQLELVKKLQSELSRTD